MKMKGTRMGSSVLLAALLIGSSVFAKELVRLIFANFSSRAKATPAVVFIQVEKQVPAGHMYQFNNPFDLFGDDFAERFFGVPRRPRPDRRAPNRNRQPMFKQTGQGSGFIISKDGYILTNTHVVGDVYTITVRLSDGREFKAKRIGADPRTEVALIKIESEGDLRCWKSAIRRSCRSVSG